MNWYNFVSEHWLVSLVAMYCFLETIEHIFSRSIRMIMVLVRGWPTMPNCDADGDIVHPKIGDKNEVPK